MKPPRNLKLTVVGDKSVGKTCLLKSYVYRSFPEGPYISTVFPFLPDEEYVYSKGIDYSGTPLLLAMWDRVYSKKEDDFIRSLQYDQTNIFLLCFDLTDKISFENIFSLWNPEVKRYCPKASCFLVGITHYKRSTFSQIELFSSYLILIRTEKVMVCPKRLKKDLSPCVTRSMGRDLAERIKAVAYLECSSKTKEGLKEVFSIAVQAAMGSPPSPPKKENCHICDSRLRRLIRLL
ncbi:rho-related protein racC [Trichonephila clavata]|uniref:Rho-related protein racC n=1 Tax=Trichonephila clavata TaxID=2740835 RepID=A0A8X6FL89_TRICU|nr:rho-related protein racC [Trichonephila clavata]